LDGLARLGHQVGRPEMPLGGGQIVGIDWKNGTLVGASEPRKDGLALGY
jgi:gamma-glutamyltranspeptidase/glutathione hydrolase